MPKELMGNFKAGVTSKNKQSEEVPGLEDLNNFEQEL